MRRLTLSLAAAGLLGLSACTEYGYVKPGVTDEVYAQDSQDCAEIARHQAFRDQPFFESRARFGRSYRYGRRRFSSFDSFRTSPSDLEFRYRRLCMVSRGYELAPLDDQGEDGESGDGPEDVQGG